ncbi:hypothetical protein AVEN_217177-1 [Araneus ventricosus]|uniref:Receptor ligand binding region domain-containing protein n=1 Tax=Araneus ventricosus TaxID=182803 RepID=A0A4Y2P4R4_ARAVE|nr:hypothetical protein AVEN_217177-1 [Araneus ventricosus]
MNGSYSQIGLIFLQVLKKFNWKVVALLFHNFDDRTLGNSDCYFTLGAVYTALGRKSFYKDFDETLPTVNYVDMLKEVSQNARDYKVFYPRVTSKDDFANQSNYAWNAARENREYKTFIQIEVEEKEE